MAFCGELVVQFSLIKLIIQENKTFARGIFYREKTQRTEVRKQMLDARCLHLKVFQLQ
jgi:hypothetical protein